jgi:hypothetical protein
MASRAIEELQAQIHIQNVEQTECFMDEGMKGMIGF